MQGFFADRISFKDAFPWFPEAFPEHESEVRKQQEQLQSEAAASNANHVKLEGELKEQREKLADLLLA